MKYRPYTPGSIPVSEVGFGGWQVGSCTARGAMSEAEAVRLISQALELDCNFFDTAPNYGGGMSETLLGRALASHRDRVVINTKCGHAADDTTSWEISALRQSVQQSLTRLRTDYLDSVMLHNPPSELLQGDSAPMRLLAQLKSAGTIRAYGASVDSAADVFTVLERSDAGVIEVLFNVFHQEPMRAFQAAREKGVALVVKVPLDSGWLSGKYNSQSRFADIRSRWTPDVLQRRMEALGQVRFLEKPGRSLAEACLAFALHPPAVSTVIPGVRSVDQLMGNLRASNCQLKDEEIQRLYDFHASTLLDHPLPW